MENKINFGLIISDLLKSQKIKKTEFANRIGYSLPGLSKILDKEDVNTDVLKKICDAFGLEMSYFLDPKPTITQSGKANIAGNGNIQYKGQGNTINPDENKLQVLTTENEHLKAQLQGLREQNQLLREMVEMLKAKP